MECVKIYGQLNKPNISSKEAALLRSLIAVLPRPDKSIAAKIGSSLEQIKTIGTSLVRKVYSKQSQLSQTEIKSLECQLFIFGSHQFSSSLPDSDCDVLLVTPKLIHRSDFFNHFPSKLKELSTSKDIVAITDSMVPLLKVTLNGIKFDIVFVALPVASLTQKSTINLEEKSLTQNLDHQSLRSLTGYRDGFKILQMVPDRVTFSIALTAIKFWAKLRGLHSNILGYLGGICWAVLLARVYLNNPDSNVIQLIGKFFETYGQYNWSQPVTLTRVKRAKDRTADKVTPMTILTPCYPQTNCAFNVNQSSGPIIFEEFRRAQLITHSIINRHWTDWDRFNWEPFFNQNQFFNQYNHFIGIIVHEIAESFGLIQMKIRHLVNMITLLETIQIAQVWPEPYTLNSDSPSRLSGSQKQNPFSKQTCNRIIWFIGFKEYQCFNYQDYYDNTAESIVSDCIKKFINIVKTSFDCELFKRTSLQCYFIPKNQLFRYISSKQIGYRLTDKFIESHLSKLTDSYDEENENEINQNGKRTLRRKQNRKKKQKRFPDFDAVREKLGLPCKSSTSSASASPSSSSSSSSASSTSSLPTTSSRVLKNSQPEIEILDSDNDDDDIQVICIVTT